MVGDTVTDVRAAANAGIPSILLTANPHAHGFDETGATHCAPSLARAVKLILSGSTTK
jgi:phosphoglycolate phosphatase-like HAD superfamily hydrolase